MISAEPEAVITDWVRERAVVCEHQAILGEWRNRMRLLEWLLNDEPEADAYLLLEDDIVFCRSVASYLTTVLWPSERCGVIQLYASYGYRRQPRGLTRLSERQCRMLLAACACLFRPEPARRIVEYANEHGWQGHPRHYIAEPADKSSTDVFFGRAMNALGTEVWMFNPSLALHIGDISSQDRVTLDPEGNRQTLNFPGENAVAAGCFGGAEHAQ